MRARALPSWACVSTSLIKTRDEDLAFSFPQRVAPSRSLNRYYFVSCIVGQRRRRYRLVFSSRRLVSHNVIMITVRQHKVDLSQKLVCHAATVSVVSLSLVFHSRKSNSHRYANDKGKKQGKRETEKDWSPFRSDPYARRRVRSTQVERTSAYHLSPIQIYTRRLWR